MKSLVVEKEMEFLRFQEEILLLQKEMHNFLVYYKDIKLPDLKIQLKAVRSEMESNILKYIQRFRPYLQEEHQVSYSRVSDKIIKTYTFSSLNNIHILTGNNTEFKDFEWEVRHHQQRH